MKKVLAVLMSAMLPLWAGAQVELRGSIQVTTIVTTNASVALVQKTGQTTSYATGDDGTYQAGVTNPASRFTILAETNQVLDNLTGLIWARQGNIGTNALTWTNAVTFCENLEYAGTNDWRLPNLRELQSLMDFGTFGYYGAFPSGHPFNVSTYPSSRPGVLHWASTTFSGNSSMAWYVSFYDGHCLYEVKPNTRYVWAIRGGR